MGGSRIDDDWDLSESSNEVRTVVLVGRAGNGKSATGNSILGREAFDSDFSCYGVTTSCEMQRTVLKNGQIVNVIDTPGLFDFSMEADSVGKEIVNCIRLAKDGIHAVLVVFSVRTRFTKEEQATIQNLKILFGEKILDYMILVFTGGDGLEKKGLTLDDYLGRMCPKPVQEILQMCKNRLVLFDNMTENESKKAEQVQKLLALVNSVVAENDGQPFSDEFFDELKKGAVMLHDLEKQVESSEGLSKQEMVELKEDIHKSYDEQIKKMIEMMEQKLKDTIEHLEKRLAEEQAARFKSEELSQLRLDEERTARLNSEESSQHEIRKLRESLEKARKETEEFQNKKSKCAIL